MTSSPLSVVLIGVFATHSLMGQAGAWVPPRTPWGDPDLQGLWPSDKLGYVPLQRPPAFGARAVLDDEEYAALVAFVERQRQIDHEAYVDRTAPLAVGGNRFRTCGDDTGGCKDGVRLSAPSYWASERGEPNRQASLIVDPPNGRFPALTPQGEEPARARAAVFAERQRCARVGCPESFENFQLWDRCVIHSGVTSLWPAGGPNSADTMGNQIIQAPGVVVILGEMIHESRIIWLDDRPRLPRELASYAGDSRGHWEGNTLVVETTGLKALIWNGVPAGSAGSSDALRVTERLTRVDPNTLHYEATIDDSQTWTATWTVAFDLELDDTYRLHEYACHEGNFYSMENRLTGAR